MQTDKPNLANYWQAEKQDQSAIISKADVFHRPIGGGKTFKVKMVLVENNGSIQGAEDVEFFKISIDEITNAPSKEMAIHKVKRKYEVKHLMDFDIDPGSDIAYQVLI